MLRKGPRLPTKGMIFAVRFQALELHIRKGVEIHASYRQWIEARFGRHIVEIILGAIFEFIWGEIDHLVGELKLEPATNVCAAKQVNRPPSSLIDHIVRA